MKDSLYAMLQRRPPEGRIYAILNKLGGRGHEKHRLAFSFDRKASQSAVECFMVMAHYSSKDYFLVAESQLIKPRSGSTFFSYKSPIRGRHVVFDTPVSVRIRKNRLGNIRVYMMG